MRFLVTGANGLVGSRLMAALAARGHQALGVSRTERWKPHPTVDPGMKGLEYRRLDLVGEREVREVIDGARPEVIVHTASMADVDACEQDPEQAFGANVVAAGHVAAAARRIGAHLVHVSTDYVFDGQAGPYGEEDSPAPHGVYASTKYMGEQAIRLLSPSWAIARTAAVYGWPPSGRANFGSWLVGALEKRQPVRLFEDQVVSPSLAESVAGMLAELGERHLTGLWNICGAVAVDRVSFGRALCGVFGFDSALCIPSKMRDARLSSPRPFRCGLRPDKAVEQLTEKPLSLSDSLLRFHADYLRYRV